MHGARGGAPGGERHGRWAHGERSKEAEIRRAVESLFDVRVLEVRTMRMPRKTRRVGRFVGRRPEWKKAVVQLAEGQGIEFFEGV